MVGSELTHGFQQNAFMMNSNGTLGGGNLYSGRVADIKGSSFMNSRVAETSQRFIRDLSHRRCAEGVQCMSCYN
jgi:hypothetical protein